MNTEGTIEKGATRYHVTCASLCGLSEISYHFKKVDFENQLTMHGWKKINKQWHCPTCARKVKP